MFSSQDPHHQVPLEGPKTVLVTTSTGGFPVPEPLASTPTYVTGMAAERIIPRSNAPISIEQIRSPPQGWEGQSPSTRAPATEKSSFGGVVTPVNVVTLYQALANHPEREIVNKRCSELREGARIGYSGPRCPRFSPNLPTAYFNPEVVTGNLTDEVSKGRTMGPFLTPPFENFQVSPIGLVPKKHSDKFQTIFHLSFPKSETSSINYFIEKDDFSLQYITIDNAIAAIQKFGPGCYMGKTDIESAFRLIPVHANDWALMGMFWNGQYYFDKVLPFGLRSAPYIFNQLSDAIKWILLNRCSISFVCHIYSGATLSYPSIKFPLSGKPVKYDLDLQKFEYPYLCNQNQGAFPNYSVHGYHTRLGKMEARLPEDKVERIKSALSTFQSQRSTTMQELQSLIGTLNFACKVIPPGRSFLQRIIHLTRKVKKPHHHIKLTTGFYKDIEMWTIPFSSMGNL